MGAAATSIPTPPTANGFICFGPGGNVPFVYHAFEWLHGTTTDLGTLGGPAECSEATSINAKGQIVGTSELDEIDPVLGIKQVRAVLWEDGKIKDLGTFGGNLSGAAGNNNRGQVVGFALNAIPDPFSFIYILLAGGASTGTQTRAFLWQNGELQDLGTLGGSDAAAFFVNERGQVAGVSSFNSEPNPLTGLPNQHAFLWQSGTMTDLGSLGGASATPSGLNNRGQVIGIFDHGGSEEFTDPYFWDGRKLIDLFTATEGKVGLVNAINDSGQVVGAGDFSSTGGSTFSAVLWQNGVATSLGTLSGDCYSEALAINSKGQVVGVSFACDTFENRAFLWEKGSMIDLNEKVPAGFTLRLANAVTINDQGEIGGFGAPAGCDDAETCGRAFLLIPTGWDDIESTSPVVQSDSVNLKHSRATESQTTTRMADRVRSRMARRPVNGGMWHVKSAN